MAGGEVWPRPSLPYGRQTTGPDRGGAIQPEINVMKRVVLLAASALALTAFLPEQANAQGRRFGVHGAWGGGR